MKSWWRINAKYLLAYGYLILAFISTLYFFSYNLRVSPRPLGWIMSNLLALLIFIVYAIINHLFIKRVLNKELIVVVEILLFLSILATIISDVNVEKTYSLRHHLKMQSEFVKEDDAKLEVIQHPFYNKSQSADSLSFEGRKTA